MKKISRDFFTRDTLIVAKELLGKYLIYEIDKQKLVTKITETEAYKGITDKACHSYGGRRTKRTEVMYDKPGTVYVYMIYGMYYCMNIVTEEIDNPCAVLIRGATPVEGLEKMSQLRYNKNHNELSKYQIKNFSNGPGKLCNALGINKYHNGLDMCNTNSILYIAESINSDEEIKIETGRRININYAEEAADFPWRFYIGG